MPDDVVIDGRIDPIVARMNLEDALGDLGKEAFMAGIQSERVRCLRILETVLQERPPSVPEALLRVGELIDAGN